MHYIQRGAALIVLAIACVNIAVAQYGSPPSGSNAAANGDSRVHSERPPPSAPIPQPPTLYGPDVASIDLIQNQLAAALRYPPYAKAKAEEGQAVVAFDVDRSGRILDVRLTQDSGSIAIDAEVLNVFKRIGSFHINVPDTQAPGQDRLTLSFGIGFYLFYESQRDPTVPADAPAGRVQAITTSLDTGTRTAFLNAVANTWQRPEPMPARYKLTLHLLLDAGGKLRDADLHQSSSNAALDASALDAVRHANLPALENPALPSREIQLCLAAPDSDCGPRDSLRYVGTTLGVFAYVPDGTAIVKRVGRYTSYIQQVEQAIRSKVIYPPNSIKKREEGSVLVHVTVLRDGTITGVKLLQPSRFEALNVEAIAVFNRIVRLPPVPDGLMPEATAFEYQLPISFELH